MLIIPQKTVIEILNMETLIPIIEHSLIEFSAGRSIQPETKGIDLGEKKEFDRLLLQENIRNGQRIEEFSLEYFDGENWLEVTKGSTIGYKRLLRFEQVSASRVRIKIISSRDCPEISELGIYKA